MENSPAERLAKEQGAFTRREWYRWVYLKSDHWLALRRSKLDQDPGCQKCRLAPAQQVHHVNYRSFYNVTLSDLLSVCNRCHAKMHGKEYNDPKPYWRLRFLKSKNSGKGKSKRRKRRTIFPMTPERQRALEHLLERGRL